MRFLTLIALVVCISYAACDGPAPYGSKEVIYGAPAKGYLARRGSYESGENSGMVHSSERGYKGDPAYRSRYHPRKLDKLVKVKSKVNVDVWQQRAKAVYPRPAYQRPAYPRPAYQNQY